MGCTGVIHYCPFNVSPAVNLSVLTRGWPELLRL